ncbi:hypothetical protein [Gracilibacillus phocaeensis]|nr:hypothetical protein [Gracilibacillus phocaeensis]
MKVLILGAAGQVAGQLRDNLLQDTNNSLVLYARNAHQRLTIKDETVIRGIDRIIIKIQYERKEDTTTNCTKQILNEKATFATATFGLIRCK